MKIKYPVLTIPSDNYFYFIKNDEDLKNCNRQSLKKGFYNNLSIIDCNSKRYTIQKAIKKNTVGILWGFNLLKGQQLKVELIFEEKVKSVSLIEFQDLLIEIMKKNQSLWDSGGDFKGIVQFIKETNSIEEIIVKLTNDFYEEN